MADSRPYHRFAHNKPVLEPWVEETIAAAGGSKESRGEKSVDFARSQLRAYLTCMEELLSQSELHDPVLTRIMQRVWDGATDLLRTTIDNYQHQLSLTSRAQVELHGILAQVRVHSQKSRYEYRKMRLELAQCKSAMERKESEVVGLRRVADDLEQENAQLRSLMVMHDAEGDGDDADPGSDDDAALAPWKRTKRGVEGLGSGMDDFFRHLQAEDGKQTKFMTDLDFHVNQLQMRVQAEAWRWATSDAVTVATQTVDMEEDEPEPFDDSVPPPPPPEVNKKGLHIPYGIRRAMSEFPANQRVMQKGVFLKTVLSWYYFKITADRMLDEAKQPRKGACAEVYNFLLQKYGLPKIADWNVTELINSCRMYAGDLGGDGESDTPAVTGGASGLATPLPPVVAIAGGGKDGATHAPEPRAGLFGRLVGAFEPPSSEDPGLHQRCLNFIVGTVSLCQDAIPESVFLPDSIHTVDIPRSKAVSVARRMFWFLASKQLSSLLVRVQDLPAPRETVQEFIGLSVDLSKFVDLDAFLDLVVHE